MPVSTGNRTKWSQAEHSSRVNGVLKSRDSAYGMSRDNKRGRSRGNIRGWFYHVLTESRDIVA